MSEVAKKGVDIATTLAKYGIKGAGIAIRCGARASGAMLSEVGSMASYFSGCSLGNSIGNFLISESQKALNSVTKKAENIGISGINALAANIKTGEIVDFCGGLKDLQNKIIKGVCDKNFPVPSPLSSSSNAT